MAAVSITSPIMHSFRILFLRFYHPPDSFLSIRLFRLRHLDLVTGEFRQHRGLIRKRRLAIGAPHRCWRMPHDGINDLFRHAAAEADGLERMPPCMVWL